MSEDAGWRQFLCRVCGLIYDEAQGDPDSGLPPGTRFDDIPDDWACPICGVGKADFEPYTPSAVPAVASRPAVGAWVRRGRGPGVLIVGAGRAGWDVAQALRQRDPLLPITLLSACSADVYDKPQLSVAVARGLKLDGLVRETALAASSRLGVRLLADTHVIHIDADRRRLRSTRGCLSWDHLVLAQGAEPALPAVLARSDVWRINHLDSYRSMRAALDASTGATPSRIVIVGAGLVGCELANDLALPGHSIHLLDLQTRPLALHLPQLAAQRLLSAWAPLDIRFTGGVRVVAIDAADDGSARRVVRLSNGESLQADHVIAATGLRIAPRLAESAGLTIDRSAGGIVVDAATGAASRPGIYALGDCAVVNGRASRFIEPIAAQADAIAAAITGQSPQAVKARSAPVLRIKTSSLPITVSGDAHAEGDWRVVRNDNERLLMHRIGPDGCPLATLMAGAVSASRLRVA